MQNLNCHGLTGEQFRQVAVVGEFLAVLDRVATGGGTVALVGRGWRETDPVTPPRLRIAFDNLALPI